MFHNCSKHSSGGAIYFYALSYGSIVLDKVCATFCATSTASLDGQFAYIYLPSSNSAKIVQTTITSCSYQTQLTPYSSVFFQNCQIVLNGVNSSRNSCHLYACFYFHTSRFLSINYSTFAYNTAHYYHLYWVTTGGTNSRTFNFCNIVGNLALTVNCGIIHSSNDRIQFLNSIFELNSDVLFSGFITLQNCSIKHSSSIFVGSLITFLYSTNTAISTSTYNFNHFSSYLCLPLSNDFNFTPCQTLPTNCFINSNQNDSINIISVLEFFFLPFFWE